MRFLLIVLMLPVAAGCVSPSQRVGAEPGALTSAGIGDLISGAPGDTLYTERSGVYEWELVVEARTLIGSYTVEPGAYPISAVGSEGYHFEPGDSCLGEPTVSGARFDDAPASLYRPAEGGQLCVYTVFDTRRCAPAQTEIRPSLSENSDLTEYTLIYDGLVAGEDDHPIAAFTLHEQDEPRIPRFDLSAPAPGVLVARGGIFQILSADADRVVLTPVRTISSNGALTEPRLLGERRDDMQQDEAALIEALEAMLDEQTRR
jgi:hypothetical protein